MNSTVYFIDDMSARLGRPISDLSDVRLVVDTLRELRLRETDVEMTITPIEVYRPDSTSTTEWATKNRPPTYQLIMSSKSNVHLK